MYNKVVESKQKIRCLLKLILSENDNINNGEKIKNEFIDLVNLFIDNDKIMSVFKYSIMVDYWLQYSTAPASTKYHDNFKRGLLFHSLMVLLGVINTIDSYYSHDLNKLSIEDIDVIAVLFHDICKVGLYTVKTEENGNITYYYDQSYAGVEHGSESLLRLFKCGYCPKSKGWELAIAYHMGVFGVSNTEMINFSKYAEKYPEVILLHHADMIASKIYTKFNRESKIDLLIPELNQN